MVSAKQVVGAVVIAYVVAIVLTFVLAILAVGLRTAFPAEGQTFISVYNGVRGLTLFIILFPITVPLITFAFLADLFFDFLLPFLNDTFNTDFPVSLMLAEAVGDQNSGLVKAILDIVNGLFPELE